jgi:hypothetical protein
MSSADDEEALRREEDEARERLREAQADAKETLEEAEQLEEQAPPEQRGSDSAEADG